VSGARDFTVKVFDFTKSSAKRASKTIKEVDMVRAVAVHPVGTRRAILKHSTGYCFLSLRLKHLAFHLFDGHHYQLFNKRIRDAEFKSFVFMVSLK